MYNCEQIPYSFVRNCTDCQKAYIDWICSTTMPRCSIESRGTVLFYFILFIFHSNFQHYIKFSQLCLMITFLYLVLKLVLKLFYLVQRVSSLLVHLKIPIPIIMIIEFAPHPNPISFHLKQQF